MGLYNSAGEKSRFWVLRSTHKKIGFLPPLMSTPISTLLPQNLERMNL